jgi:hypothetical protein
MSSDLGKQNIGINLIENAKRCAHIDATTEVGDTPFGHIYLEDLNGRCGFFKFSQDPGPRLFS